MGKWKRMKRKTETESCNGKLKWKAETEKLKFGNGRHNCSKGYLLRMRELCNITVFLSIYWELALRTRL